MVRSQRNIPPAYADVLHAVREALADAGVRAFPTRLGDRVLYYWDGRDGRPDELLATGTRDRLIWNGFTCQLLGTTIECHRLMSFAVMGG